MPDKCAFTDCLIIANANLDHAHCRHAAHAKVLMCLQCGQFPGTYNWGLLRTQDGLDQSPQSSSLDLLLGNSHLYLQLQETTSFQGLTAGLNLHL